MALALGGLSAASSAYADSGDLDPTFSDDGKLTTDFGDSDSAESVALQADGKLVAAGQGGSNREFALARYNPDGSLDTSFSGDGKQTTDFAGGRAQAVALQSDGKILAAGYSGYSGGDFALARYNPDGSLDTSFSGDGKQTTDFGSPFDLAFDIALQADGKIVLSGCTIQVQGGTQSCENTDRGSGDFALARYNPDGSLDTSFSGDGKQTTDFGTYDGALAIALQSDGKIVSAGYSGGDFALARYNPDGSLDTSFSGDGKQTTDFSGSTAPASDSIRDVTIQSDGKIVAVGSSGMFALARYNPDGSLDTNFSDDGKTTDIGGSVSGVALQPNGKIVVAGTTIVGLFSPAFVLERYNTNGSLDTTFSGDGKQTTEFANNVANDLVLQEDGKIVVAGGQNDFALARFEGGEADTTPPDTTIDSGSFGPTPESTPTFSFSSSEARSTFQCRVDAGAFAPCSSPHTTASLSDGPHTFEVRAIDPAGNIDPTPASRSFTVNTGQPQPTQTPPPPQSQSSPAPFIAPPSAATDPPEIGGPSSAGTLTVSSKGLFTLRSHTVDCTGSGPDCAVRTSVTGTLPAGTASSSARRKTVKLGGSSFKVKAGQKSKVKLKLNRKGLKLLKRVKRIKAKVTITVKRGTSTAKKTVKVTLKAPKRAK